MTSRATKTASVTNETTPVADEAESVWGSFPLHGRDVVFNRPTPEQLMVLRRLARQLDEAGALPSRKLITMAKILDAASACMVDDATRDYVDQLVLDRKIDVDELAPLIQLALVGDAGMKELAAPKNGPVRRVRRR